MGNSQSLTEEMHNISLHMGNKDNYELLSKALESLLAKIKSNPVKYIAVLKEEPKVIPISESWFLFNFSMSVLKQFFNDNLKSIQRQ